MANRALIVSRYYQTMMPLNEALKTIDQELASNSLATGVMPTGLPSPDRFIPDLNLAISLPIIITNIDNWPHDRLSIAKLIRAYRAASIDWIIIPLDVMIDEAHLRKFIQDEIRLRTEPIDHAPVYKHDKTRRAELNIQNAISLYTTVDGRWFTAWTRCHGQLLDIHDYDDWILDYNHLLSSIKSPTGKTMTVLSIDLPYYRGDSYYSRLGLTRVHSVREEQVQVNATVIAPDGSKTSFREALRAIGSSIQSARVEDSSEAAGELLAAGYKIAYSPGLQSFGASKTISREDDENSPIDLSMIDHLESLRDDDLLALFPGRSVYEIRKTEKLQGKYCKTFPDWLKTIDVDKIIEAREDNLFFDGVAEELGLTERQAEKACRFYGLDLSKSQKSKQVSIQMGNYKAKTGFGSPAADPIVREKIAATNMARYGSSNYFASAAFLESRADHDWTHTPDVDAKRNSTMVARYGGASPFCDERIQEKTKETNRSTYGVEYATQSETIKRKTRETNRKRYGSKWAGHSADSLEKRGKTLLAKYGYEPCPGKTPAELSPFDFKETQQAVVDSLHRAGRDGSAVQSKVKTMMDAIIGEESVTDRMILHGREIDLLYPRHRIGIEVSPAATHNDNETQLNHIIKRRGPEDAVDKTMKAAANGITLLTLFDWSLNDDNLQSISRYVRWLADGAIVKPINNDSVHVILIREDIDVDRWNHVLRLDGLPWPLSAYTASDNLREVDLQLESGDDSLINASVLLAGNKILKIDAPFEWMQTIVSALSRASTPGHASIGSSINSTLGKMTLEVDYGLRLDLLFPGFAQQVIPPRTIYCLNNKHKYLPSIDSVDGRWLKCYDYGAVSLSI